MDNNDIFRRIRYTFNYGDNKMIELFAMGNHQTNRAEISDWLKKEGDQTFQELPDKMLATFLNGFIIEKRGKREGDQPVAEEVLNNNIILRKLKIALDLKSDDILDMFELVGRSISTHELSAFLRNPKQSRYRECNDQYLRNFLSGMQERYRPYEEKGEIPDS